MFSEVAAQLVIKKFCGEIKIDHEQYQAWRHGYLFEALKNQRYGQSFCNQFNIQDNILFYEQNQEWADNYIRGHYVDNSKSTAC